MLLERTQVTALEAPKPSSDKRKKTFLERNVSWQTVKAISCVLGLTGSLMVYGILQEGIMTLPFGPEKARFRHTLFLVLINRLIACSFALVFVIFSEDQLEPVAPITSYSVISFANIISSACQYEALKYVSFPVQVLAKSAKTIPVMIWQSIISRKTYTFGEYLEAFLVALGCAVFLLTGEISSSGVPGLPSNKMHFVWFMGGGILVMYLAVDGFTSTWQDRLFNGYQMGVANQVLYTTMCSIILSLAGLVFTNKLTPALEFVRTYPESWWWILGISLASAIVQFLVTHTIKEYGALIFATVMTTRQWFSILLSCLIFAHPLSMGQWLGTVLVFGVLYRRFFAKKKKQQPNITSASRDQIPL
eukprot:g5555.t1